MHGMSALYECNGLAKDRYVAFDNALDVVGSSQSAASKTSALEIGIYDRGLFDAAIDDESLVFFVVLGVYHGEVLYVISREVGPFFLIFY